MPRPGPRKTGRPSRSRREAAGRGPASRPHGREALIAAVRAHLDERGLEGLGLREVARRAGFSHGAPRRHFGDLAGLLSAAAAEGFRELMEAITKAIDELGPGASAVQRLAAAGKGYLRFAAASPGVFGLMFRPELFDSEHAELAEAGSASFGQLLELVSAAQAEGLHPEVKTRELASAHWAFVHGLATLRLTGSLDGAAPGPVDGGRVLELGNALLLGAVPASDPQPVSGAQPLRSRAPRRKT